MDIINNDKQNKLLQCKLKSWGKKIANSRLEPTNQDIHEENILSKN